MGACLSAATGGSIPIIADLSDGDQAAFDALYKVDKILGEGEFGQVTLVHAISGENREAPQQRYACKTLRKGAVFKDNTLWPPMPAKLLRGEVEMMQTLAGKQYCLELCKVFETKTALLLVMECCAGGEMEEYVAQQTQDLRTEDGEK
ncbi:MAG: hypothetical protein SGARI_005658 [Bacillariaceae sp.]